VSILPLETEFGRKREIDQSSCNKDYSCVNGFCPSFVSVEGGQLKKSSAGKSKTDNFGPLPQPTLPRLDTFQGEQPYGILITGIGGTGVITIGALLGMAAHLEGKGVSVLDMTGMSQKNGSVMSHVRIAALPDHIRAVRLASGEADVVLGCDMMTAASADAISKMELGRGRAVINTHAVPSGAFAQQPDWQYPADDMRALIEEAVGRDAVAFLDATSIATALMGDSIATNLFVLGFAWQRGLIPLSEAAILRAIVLNGVAIESNQKSFLWGRRAAHDMAAVENIAHPAKTVSITHLLPQSLDKLVARRVEFLASYQDAAYARRYEALVAKVRAAEASNGGGQQLARAVAKNYFKLMAYKDEYEVARLYTDGAFVERVKRQFEGDFTLRFHLAPPLFAKVDAATGKLIKATYGPWMMKAFGMLARLKFLRGTALDIFGRTAERKSERALITEYEAMVDELLANLAPEKQGLAVELASLPEEIRGFGHVKEAALAKVGAKRDELLAAWRSPGAPLKRAA
jgi:indolepyruvate ferredoxin oxidoreductase